MLETGGDIADFVNDSGIFIVKDMLGTTGPDKIRVARAAGGDHIKAAKRGQLDGV